MVSFITNNRRRIAVAAQTGQTPGLFFLGGYFSDMTGTKAQFLAESCAAAQRAFVRFDYSGHGQSEGRFREGCIGDWFSDALAVFDQCTAGPQLVIGSSMGGWLALKLALTRPERVMGLIGIAAAPDFTEDLVWAMLDDTDKTRMQRDGYLAGKGADALIYTHKLIEEGRQHLLLRAPLTLACPVRLLQGQQDDAVPWQTALKIQQALPAGQTDVQLIADGDHRLSRPQDLALLWRTIESLV